MGHGSHIRRNLARAAAVMLLTSPPVFAEDSILPATPLRPAVGAVLPKAARRVRFVWEAPAAPVPVRYFV